ncbi:hypothetical protein C2845_PM01G00810 [Panicum miliaceum]|uniref:Uncharacterized protein n=1 Tax=Panicum miliaceum TaxID=4540 RepID=A0A3L6TMA4_PANMI|nr:hypothetical protein C2845_PM01G00810 [Panicum miliaceum]
MGQIQVLTGSSGQIRAKCSALHHNNRDASTTEHAPIGRDSSEDNGCLVLWSAATDGASAGCVADGEPCGASVLPR